MELIMATGRPVRSPDVMIVGASLLFGFAAAWQWNFREPWDIETALGFERSMSGYEQRIIDYRSRVEAYRRGNESTAALVSRYVANAFGLLPIPLAAMTLGIGLATFRRPYALGRRSRRSLGVVTTGLAALLIASWLAAEIAARYVLRGNRMISGIWDDMRFVIGLAVLALWVVLIMGCIRKRPIDAWDRIGRWLGYAWLMDLAWTSALIFVARGFSHG
jgi:hypothetical protein